MIFNIFHDSGDRISGTVIPDSYSDVCHIRVGVGGREIAVFPTNEFNPGALAQGLHESGLVNFSITEQSLPGLPLCRLGHSRSQDRHSVISPVSAINAFREM